MHLPHFNRMCKTSNQKYYKKYDKYINFTDKQNPNKDEETTPNHLLHRIASCR